MLADEPVKVGAESSICSFLSNGDAVNLQSIKSNTHVAPPPQKKKDCERLVLFCVCVCGKHTFVMRFLLDVV